jgi:hypothetical protein
VPSDWIPAIYWQADTQVDRQSTLNMLRLECAMLEPERRGHAGTNASIKLFVMMHCAICYSYVNGGRQLKSRVKFTRC